MVMMTVYRQAEAPQQVDHLVIMRSAVDNEATAMILYARHNKKPTLVGLSGGQAIVKPQEAGDDGLSFEALYDTAVSIREYREMMRHKVTTVEALPPTIYEMIVGLEASATPRVKVRIQAGDEVDVRERLQKLINQNVEFRETLIRALIKRMIDSSDVAFVHSGAHRDGDAPPGTPEWEVVDVD